MAIQRDYFTNKTPSVAISSFLEDFRISLLSWNHQLDGSEIKNFSNSHLSIQAFFKECPIEFHEEVFIHLVSIFVDLYPKEKNIYHNTLMMNEWFFNIVNLDIFNEIKPRLSQHLNTEKTVSIIRYLLSHELFDLANEYKNILLKKEQHSITYFNDELTYFLRYKKYAGIHHLLDNYHSWNDQNIISTFFDSNQYDDVLLHKLMSKLQSIDLTSSIGKKIALSLLSSSFSQETKMDLLNQYVGTPAYIYEVHSLYDSFLQKNKIDFTNLPQNSLYRQFSNEKYLISWIEKNTLDFLQNVAFLKEKGLVDNKILIDLLPSIFKNTVLFDQLKIFMKLINKNWNDSVIQEVFIQQCHLNHTAGAYHLIEQYKNIDFNIPLDISIDNVHYQSLHDYFTQQKHFIYQFYQLSIEKNEEKKIAIFNNILNQSMDFHDNTYHNSFIKSPLFEDFYQFARKQIPNQTEFFIHWFLKFSTHYDGVSQEIKEHFFNRFTQEQYQLVFNLSEINPYFVFLEEQTVRNNNKTSFKNSFEGRFFNRLGSLFGYQGGHLTNKTNIKLVDFLKKDMDYSVEHTLYENLIKNIPRQKNSFFNIFSEKTPPLQLIITNKKSLIIDDPKEIIQTSNSTIQTEVASTSFNSNKLNDILSQAKQDSIALQNIFDHYQDKNLNLEVKIRAENLVLYQINFLKSIENAVEAINIEDMFFLKNNLGKYLLQCIDTYGKSITRYEIVNDSRNSKLFSKHSQTDLDNRKEIIDQEALKQLTLLEKELDLVKEHILNQFDADLLRDMRINTRFIQSKMENNPLIQEEQGKLINLKIKP